MRKHSNQLGNNMFIINCKNYDEIAGDKIVKMAKIAEKISKKYKVSIAIAPPHNLIPLITKFKITVLAQHVDDKKVGSTTGFMVPEIVKKSQVSGSIINHSEHRISEKEIISLVKRLQKLKLKTVLCVKNVNEAKKYAKILGYNYNSSEWFEQSYKIFNQDYKSTAIASIEKKKDESKLRKIIKKIR